MNLAASLARRVEALRPRQVFIFVFLAGFLVRAAGMLASHQYRDLERFELEKIAISLAETGVFGNPYAIPTGPSAHVSPGYPLLLAAIFRVFGTGIPAEIVKQLFACACSALVAALLPWVARALELPAVCGFTAAVFTALLPIKFKTETQGDWESPFAALTLLWITGLTAITWREQRFTTLRGFLMGLAWGITLLFVSAYSPLLLALVLLGLFFAPAGRKRAYLVYSATLLLAAGLCLAPWALRNQRALGSLIAGRDNTGIELRVSNNPYAYASAERNFVQGVMHRYHPFQSAAVAQQVRSLGEVPFNRLALAEARDWITANPGRFLQLSLERARWYWFFGDRRSLPRAVVLGTYTILAFAGLYFLYRLNRLSFAIAAVTLLVVPLPSYLVHVGPKHRYPIDWLLVLLASLTVWHWLVQRTRSSR